MPYLMTVGCGGGNGDDHDDHDDVSTLAQGCRLMMSA